MNMGIQYFSKVRQRYLYGFLLILAFSLYANTLGHDYAQDDAILITNNDFTKEGISGIPKILSNDTFLGFFKTESKLHNVSGGRYRPTSQVMFAIEYEIFGEKPLIGHFVNVLLYALLGILIFRGLHYIFLHSRPKLKEYAKTLAFVSAVIYIAHPVHTEVVANIKGRDELLAMICSMASMLWVWKHHFEKQKKYILYAVITFFVGLMSKEHTISFLAIIPLSLLLLGGQKLKSAMKSTVLLSIPAILFVVLRASIVKAGIMEIPMELMNNPFLKLEEGAYVSFSVLEKLATIIFIMGKYIGLLIFPHPLTHDYYPMEIGIKQISDPVVLIILGFIITIFYLTWKNFKKENIFSYTVLFYAASLFLMSNIIFPIGTNMNERFLFMPSLAFAMLAAYGLIFTLKKQKVSLGVLTVVIGLYAVKTISRNRVWKDDFTLFTTDVRTSKKSAKVLNAAGGTLLNRSESITNKKKRLELVKQAEEYLQQAIEIHPTYGNAHLLMGNANFYQEEYEKAIKYYERVQELQPNNTSVIKNLAIALRDAGRKAGEKQNDLKKAENYLLRSYGLVNTDSETIRLLGIAAGMQGKHQEAIRYFSKVVEMKPNEKSSYENLLKAYVNSGDEQKVKELEEKIKTMN